MTYLSTLLLTLQEPELQPNSQNRQPHFINKNQKSRDSIKGIVYMQLIRKGFLESMLNKSVPEFLACYMSIAKFRSRFAKKRRALVCVYICETACERWKWWNLLWNKGLLLPSTTTHKSTHTKGPTNFMPTSVRQWARQRHDIIAAHDNDMTSWQHTLQRSQQHLHGGSRDLPPLLLQALKSPRIGEDSLPVRYTQY